VQGLSVDGTGKLNVNASVSSGPTNITQVGGSNVGATNGLPVSGQNAGTLYVLATDTSGRIILVPNTAFNLAQIGGVAPQLDNTHELGVSLYGKGNGAAGDTPIALDASGRVQTANYIGGAAVGVTNPYISADQIRQWCINGNVFTASVEQTAGGTNAGISLYIPASTAKSILVVSAHGAGSGGGGIMQVTTQATDFALGSTGLVGPYNQNYASATTSALTVSGSKSATVAGTQKDSGFSGQAFTEYDLLAAATKVIYYPANQGSALAIGFWFVPATTGAILGLGVTWVEW
jgi:hypothetical protein